MTNDQSPFERELRNVFASVSAPPPPASWHGGRTSAGPRLPRMAWRMAGAGALAAAVIAASVTVPRLLPGRPGSPSPRSPLTVTALAASAGLSCRLPIAALSNDRTTGFVVFRNGQASFEPVTTNGTTYVPALHRWVDALPQLVARDGRSYVRQEGSRDGSVMTIHVVDASGDRTLLTVHLPNKGELNPAPVPSVFAFTAQGILLLEQGGGPDSAPLHLQLLDPATGAVRPFPHPSPAMPMPPGAGSSGGAEYVRGDESIWLTGYDATTDSTTLQRYDLATGATTTWFDGRVDGHGHVQGVIGTDTRGEPIVQLANQDLFHTDPARRAGIHEQVMLLTAPHTAKVLNQGTVGSPGVAGDMALSVNDGSRVWMAADDGTVWMYSPAGGLQEMAKVVETSNQGPPGVVVSGPCQ